MGKSQPPHCYPRAFRSCHLGRCVSFTCLRRNRPVCSPATFALIVDVRNRILEKRAVNSRLSLVPRFKMVPVPFSSIATIQMPSLPTSKPSSNLARVGLFFSPPRSLSWWIGYIQVEMRGSVIDYGQALPVQEERNGNFAPQSFRETFVLHAPSRSSPRLHPLQLPPFPSKNPPPMSLTLPHPDSPSITLPYNYSPR